MIYFRYFVEEEKERRDREPEAIVLKQIADRQETEQFYLLKFREYILNSNRISRLQAKYDHIRNCLGDQVKFYRNFMYDHLDFQNYK